MHLETNFERSFVCVVFRKKEEVRKSEVWLCLAEKKLCQQRVYNTTKGSNVDGGRRKKKKQIERRKME